MSGVLAAIFCRKVVADLMVSGDASCTCKRLCRPVTLRWPPIRAIDGPAPGSERPMRFLFIDDSGKPDPKDHSKVLAFAGFSLDEADFHSFRR